MSTLYKFPNYNIEVRDELALSKPELETFFQSGEKVACSTTVAPFDLVLGLDSEDRFSLHWNKAGEKKPIVYELDFIRVENGKNLAVLKSLSGYAVITDDGDINITPDIDVRR